MLDGKLLRKPAHKVTPVLPKIEAKPKLRKLVAAFGRTGAGIMTDQPLPDPDMSVPIMSPRKHKPKPKPKGPATPGRLAMPIEHIQREGGNAPAEGNERPWHEISTQEEATHALDQLISQVHQWSDTDEQAQDDVLVAMQRRIRDRIFEHRRQSPDITTAFDTRVEEVLNFMMQAPGTEGDDRRPAAIKKRYVKMAATCSL
jgi:hypothetical protein